MIIETVKQLKVRSTGNDIDDGYTAGIDESSMPFVFEILSTGFYSNAIGSVIREISSNCFDSHIEANVDDPVIISKTYKSDEGYAIEFKDMGIGLSPERIETIYMNYFSSTKRESNDMIGGFGLGSKTPLAYTDLFYITTISDGLKYQYIFHKGEDKPKLESLLGYDESYYDEEVQELNEDTGEWEFTGETREIMIKTPIGEPTEEHNGTTIKIVMRREDVGKFEEELKFQLAYFDNVYFVGWNLNNHYDIYEGKYFKFRSDIKQTKYLHQTPTEIHICIGKVRYAIDFSKVKIPEKYKYIPIAVKFEIGELQVTPNRETIRYRSETIALVEQRIILAAEEVLGLFEKENPEIEDIRDYFKIVNETPKITFDGYKQHYLYLWYNSDISKTFKFKPISHLGIKTPKNMFFMWECIGVISNGVRSKAYETIDNGFIVSSKYIIVRKGESASTYTDIYISKEINSNYNGTYLIRRKELDVEQTFENLGLKNSKSLGKAKSALEYRNVIDKIVAEKSLGYYSQFKPSEEWVNEYKKSIRESSLAYQRKINKRIFVRTASSGFSGVEMKVSELQNRTGILVYGFKEDKEILNKIYTTVINNKKSIVGLGKGTDKRDKAFMVLQISKAVEKDIVPDLKFSKEGKSLPCKTIYWTEFFNTKFFRKIETSYYIQNQLESMQFSNLKFRKLFIRDFEKDYLEVKKSITDYTRYFSISEQYLTNNYIKQMLIPLKKFKEKHKDFHIPLVSSLCYIENHKEDIAEYLKYKGIKLNNVFYLKDKRQLEYETNLKFILKSFKCKQTNLLTYTLNQENNVNEESSS